MQKSTTVGLSALQEAIQRQIEESGAELGVAVRHVESGVDLFVHPDALYPMASVFKIPILIETLAQVDEGRHALNARVELLMQDKVLPSGILTEMQPGLTPTLHDLLTLMIIISDNTATDLVLTQIGIEHIEPRLRSFGCQAISVRMSVQDLFDATFGERVDTDLRTYETARTLQAKGPFWNKLTNQRTLRNNVASPRDMCRLLERLVGGELLSAQSTQLALDILLRQQLGQRLPRFMPPWVAFAHKTGTFLQSRNDAGIIFLPDGTHLVLVTFAILRRDLLEADPTVVVPYIDRVDACMGFIARAAYDTFTRSADGQS